MGSILGRILIQSIDGHLTGTSCRHWSLLDINLALSTTSSSTSPNGHPLYTRNTTAPVSFSLRRRPRQQMSFSPAILTLLLSHLNPMEASNQARYSLEFIIEQNLVRLGEWMKLHYPLCHLQATSSPAIQHDLCALVAKSARWDRLPFSDH